MEKSHFRWTSFWGAGQTRRYHHSTVRNLQSVHRSLHVTDGQNLPPHGVSGTFIRFSIQRRSVIGSDRAFKSAVVVDPQHLSQVRRAAIVERFSKVRLGALHIAKVHKKYFLLRRPFERQRRDIL